MEFRFKWPKELYGTDDPEPALGKDWPKRVFESVMNQIIQSSNNGSIPAGLHARTYGRVLAALDVANGEVVDLERGDVEYLRDALFHDKAAVHPIYTRPLRLYQQEVERVLKE